MTKDPRSLPYRPCVGVVLFNPAGRVFVGRRIDTDLAAWQMPQGGVDPGEDLQDAAIRELREEVGTDNVDILERTRDWLYYDLPPNLVGKVWKGQYRGQKQHWFAMRFLGDDREIDLSAHHPEFSDWQWVPLETTPSLIVPFKRGVYERLVDEFGKYAEPV